MRKTIMLTIIAAGMALAGILAPDVQAGHDCRTKEFTVYSEMFGFSNYVDGYGIDRVVLSSRTGKLYTVLPSEPYFGDKFDIVWTRNQAVSGKQRCQADGCHIIRAWVLLCKK